MKNLYENNDHFQIILEINKIFKIKYFPYKFAEMLIYNHSNLIDEDIHTIFPKELVEDHKIYIMKYLLLNKDYRLSKRMFVFTSDKKMYPSQFKACVLPNYGKNILLIGDFKILKEDDFRIYNFVARSDFNIISQNTNLEKFYKIDTELLNKLDADILKLFNISRDLVESKLRPKITQIINNNDNKILLGRFSNI
jgi:hypothetical protein